MAKKINCTAALKAAKKKIADETKNMTDKERHEYYRVKTLAAVERFRNATAEARDEQLLIRLTKSEKEILERDVAFENAKSVSALVRSRAIVKESPFQLILNRLDSIAKDISTLKKKLRL